MRMTQITITKQVVSLKAAFNLIKNRILRTTFIILFNMVTPLSDKEQFLIIKRKVEAEEMFKSSGEDPTRIKFKFKGNPLTKHHIIPANKLREYF